ncbi:CIS tube protein [Flavobacterium chungangense]|uniref:Contractile injection system tube protein N-terminal domain-containing protein n=1 Tax=Flavobacterium chungangense TaxID=554283 RepID=A0A6V6Z9F6_9FLAO|nr:hypothetical protein [Flavobacterium chungangense]CAD0007542.1 hypothetical protein FLACHUCJ7_03371 [Flavobacterium chungangense]
MASLELMKITGYTDEEFQNKFSASPYAFMINPDTIKIQKSIEYNEQQAPATSSASQKYKSTPSDKLSFEIIIDCTGIVDAKRIDMAQEIEALETIIYTYNGKIHRPNFVKVQWGQNITFNGVLDSIDISYTLFKPDGSPLRAKISLAFSQYISPKSVTMIDAPQSPDLTHIVNVTEGMSLPQLCLQTWDDDSLYIQVAQFNNLNKFRNLKGIDKLIFPPVNPS